MTSSGQRHGAPVDTEDVDTEEASAPVESTRVLRLALNTLWDALDELPPRMTEEPVADALMSINGLINKIEDAALRKSGHAEHYLIIRPLSPVSPPPPDIMEKINAAVRTLAELGMVVGQNDASYRD